ncbi:MAG: hypothetical protein M1269_13870 [Chloroflexi bacterium]|nr:hypothetical protein [Chloroflexota bacterium]
MKKSIFIITALILLLSSVPAWAAQPAVYINGAAVPDYMLVMRNGDPWIMGEKFLGGFKIDYDVNYMGPYLIIGGRQFSQCAMFNNEIYVPLKGMSEFIGATYKINDGGIFIDYNAASPAAVLQPAVKQADETPDAPSPDKPVPLEAQEIDLSMGQKDDFLGGEPLLLTLKIANTSSSQIDRALATITLVDTKDSIISGVKLLLLRMGPGERRTVVINFTRSWGNDMRSRYELTEPLDVKKIVSDTEAEVKPKYNSKIEYYIVHPEIQFSIPDPGFDGY